MEKTLDIVIVNWNAGRLLYECLESIALADRTGFYLKRVVIVDNASTDSSLSELEKLDLPLHIIHNSINLGFAAACNQGVKNSSADYLLFLNPDIRLFHDSLSKPINFMASTDNKGIGILGIQLIDDKKKVSRSCARFPTPMLFLSRTLGFDILFPSIFKSHFMKDWDHKENKIVNHVIGAFFLVRHALFNELGGFDERFFVYLEDVDFSLRAKELGFDSYYLIEAQAYHKGGGTSEQIKAVRLFYSLRSKLLYSFKHFCLKASISLLLLTLFVEPIMRIFFSVIKLSGKGVLETLKGYALLWSNLPIFLKKT